MCGCLISQGARRSLTTHLRSSHALRSLLTKHICSPSQSPWLAHRLHLEISGVQRAAGAALFQEAVAVELCQRRGRQPAPAMQAVHILARDKGDLSHAMQSQDCLGMAREVCIRGGDGAVGNCVFAAPRSRTISKPSSAHLVREGWCRIGKADGGAGQRLARVLQRPDAAGASKVGDASARADARAGEHDHFLRLPHLTSCVVAVWSIIS